MEGQTQLDLYVFKAVCTNVVDGDTVDLTIDLGFDVHAKKRVRLLHVNTPERGEDGYSEAKLFVALWLQDQTCYVRTYKDDAFGRWLGNVYLKINDEYVSIGDMLLEEGLAALYLKGGTVNAL